MDGVVLNVTLEASPRLYNDALDLVANHCHDKLAAAANTATNTTNNSSSFSSLHKYGCDHFDLILGDYYTNPHRSLCVDFTPPMLRTTMTTVRYLQASRTPILRRTIPPWPKPNWRAQPLACPKARTS